MIRVASAPLTADLSKFSRWLTGQGLPHRIVEEAGGQAIYLETAQYQEQIQLALQSYLADEDFKQRVDNTKPIWQVSRQSPFASLYPRVLPHQAPAIFSLIAISLLVAWATSFGQSGALRSALLIIDPLQVSADLRTMGGRIDGLLQILGSGQLWRLVSPDFLHFSLMHICFNLLMLWVLGGQFEMRQGSAAFLNMAVFVSVVSNIAQLLDESFLFGGLSGVVYGLIGYCWIWRRKDPTIFMPDPIFKFSLVWLLIGYTPLTESLGWGSMANSAHLYGLLAGMFWGAITAKAATVKAEKSKSP